MATISPSVIPDFPDILQVAEHTGRHDRIAVDFDLGTIAGSEASFAEFRTNLTGDFPGDSGVHRRVFTSSGLHRSPTRWTIVRRGPLFSGLLEARPQTGQATEERRWKLTARLALNPTRWLSHQRTSFGRQPSDALAEVPVRLFEADEVLSFAEVELVGGNNVHIGTPRHLRLAAPERWMPSLERHLDAVLAFLRQTIQLAANEAGGLELSFPEIKATVKEVEVHWEFWNERPLQIMRDLASRVSTLAASSSTAWWQLTAEAQQALSANGSIEVGVADNSPRILLRTGKGTQLRIYAKTNKRVRFEVEFKCADVPFEFIGKRSNLSFQELMLFISNLRGHAAGRLNPVLTALIPDASTVISQRHVHELFSSIFRAAKDTESASRIVEMLIATGRVVTREGLSEDVLRLRSRGILEMGARQGQSRTYQVTAEYRDALERLRRASDHEVRPIAGLS